MKRITKVIAILLAMVLMFNGCMHVTDTATINSDGTATYSSYVEIDKQMADTNLASLGVVDAEAFLKETYAETSTDITVITGEDGKQYYTMKDEYKCDSLVDFVSELTYTSSYENVYVTTDTFYVEKNMEEIASEQAPGQDVSTIMEGEVSIIMPAPITSTTGTVDSTNPNKVTFKLNVTGDNVFFATTSATNTLTATKAAVKKMYSVKTPKIKSVKIKKIKGKKATVSVKLKKMKNVDISLEASTNKKFTKNYEFGLVKKNKGTISNLKVGKKYFIRAIAYTTNECGISVESDYSKLYKIKIKK